MKLSHFIQILSHHGTSLIPTSSALSLYAGQATPFLEVYSTIDFMELIRKGFSYSFMQHPLWDIFFELEETVVCFKTVSMRTLHDIRHKTSRSYPLPGFSYQIPAGSYFDSSGTRFCLKHDTETGKICTDSLYYYLKFLLIKGELPEYNISVNFLPANPDVIPHAVEWKLFHTLITHKKAAFFVSHLGQSNVLFYFFPQLEILRHVDQEKDYHPEGNVFEHTLACFKYLKRPTLTLALAILFHDLGKAFTNKNNREQPFYKHSSISARKVKQALSSEIYSARVREYVYYLVRYHMYPPFLFYRSRKTIQKITQHPAFDELIKLYRADLLSTFKDDSSYQRVLKQYKEYKNSLSHTLHVLD